MRALRRIATPASVAAALTGCSFPIDDYKAPARSDASLSTNGDAAHYDDAQSVDAAAGDACVCVHELKGECKQWSPPGCAR